MFKQLLLSLFLLAVAHHAQASQAQQNKALRIVALSPHIVENLYAIGAGDKIIATVEHADYPAAAKAIPRIGGFYGISIEKLLALKPDLVIAWQGGNRAEDLAQLERLGIRLHYSNPHTPAEVADDLLALGKLTGNIAQSERAAQAYSTKLAAIQAHQQHKMPVTAFYQLWSEPMMTVAKNTWINQLMETCQSSNVFANSATDYPQVSIENVVVAQPQIIIIPDEKSATPQPKINWQQWPEIPAVKQQLFISVNADLLHRFSPRMLEGLADMCDKIELSRQHLKSTQ